MISGLSSGIDWRTMVDQLIAIDRSQVTHIENQISTMEGQRSAWQMLNGKLETFRNAMVTLRDSDSFYKFAASHSSSSSTEALDLLVATVGTGGSATSFGIEVQQVAVAEKLGSASFSAQDSALAYSGEFIVGGRTISIAVTDDLQDIRTKINQANTGSTPSGVTASIQSTASGGYRLVLTSSDTGSSGIALQDASGSDVLQSLGFVNTGTEIKNTTSSGAQSDTLTSTDTAVSSILGLSSAPSGNVTVGAYTNIAIDLSDSLAQIKDDINTAAAGQGATQDIASIVSETASDGSTVYRLKLIATSYTDDGNALQALGILQATHGSVAEVHQSSALATTSGYGSANITAASYFGQINSGGDANNIVNGDTISITGTDNAGATVSGSFTITDADPATGTQVSGLLTQIETLFGDVTASVSDGKITVTDNVSGESQLSINLVANNEGGGTLDLGDVSVTTEGRAMQIQAGQDATIVVDGATYTRSNNNIDDVVAGVNLELRKAEVGTTVTVDLTRNANAISGTIESFVTAFNDVVSYVNQHQVYDEETNQAGGPLFGDSTLASVKTEIMNGILSTVTGATEDYDSLALIGITMTDTGELSMDKSKIGDLIDTDFQTILNFFAIGGSSSSSDLQYVASTRDSVVGSYAINITQFASQGSVTGTADLNDADGFGSAPGDEDYLTITDKNTGQVAIIHLTYGMDLDDIIAAINSEMNRDYTQLLTEDSGHSKTTAAGGGVISSTTTFAEIDTGGDANGVSNGDKIIINVTRTGGETRNVEFVISDKDSQTIGDLLNEIEIQFGNSVTASVDGSGKIIITENSEGTSSAALTLSGDGALTFDTMSTTTTGRYAMSITASDGGSGHLTLTHNDYGGTDGFTVGATTHLGIAAAEYAGQDVAGTIGGEAATGSGQILIGDSGNANTDGLKVKHTGTSTGAIGTLTFNAGFAENIERILYGYTDPLEGIIELKRDSMQTSIDTMGSNIEAIDKRLDLKRERLINQFVAMEKLMSSLQMQSSWLSQQLSSF